MFNIDDLIVVKKEDDKPNYEIPKCLMCIDWNGKPSIIKVLNEEKCNNETIQFISDMISEYEFCDDAGVYLVNIWIQSCESFNGETTEYDVDLEFGKMIPIQLKLNLEEIYK